MRAGVPLAEGMYRPLSAAVEAWHFDFACPPDESGRKTLDLEFAADGRFNAVIFWYTLHLGDGITLTTAPGAAKSGADCAAFPCFSVSLDSTCQERVCILGRASEPGCLMCMRCRFQGASLATPNAAGHQ
jgi:hypothetical protein